MNGKSNEDFESLKFLTECGFKEAALFWNRNNVFLLANLASLSAAFAYLSGADSISWGERALIGLFGLGICVIWWLVTAASRRMNHNWMDRAKNVAKRIGDSEVIQALEGTPTGAVTKESSKSATWLMYPLAVIFALAWLTISMLGV